MGNFPNLRFPGFEGSWTSIKIENIAPLQRGFDLPLQNIVNGNIPIVYSNGILKFHNESKCTAPGLVTGRSGTIGKFTFLEEGEYWPHNTSLWVTNFFDNDPKFIYYLYHTINIENFSTGSGVPTLNRNYVHNQICNIPPVSEQKKISSFLTLIDNRISTQRKIIEQLETLMKASREKVFSQKLRFKDEQGNDFPDWGLTELKNVCFIIGGGTPDTQKSEFWNGNIQWFTPTEIKSNFVFKSDRTISELGLKNSSAKILPKGSILLTTRATIGEVAIAQEECTTNQGFQSLIVKENCNNVFLFYWIKENKFELIRRANGSTFPEISKSEIELIKISLPPLEEQTKIANFLSSIQEKIEMEKQILEKLELQKKFLLANLFV